MQPDQATTVLQFLLPTLEKEIETTRKVLAAVPSDKGDYRPDERSMSALELCWHIAGAEAFFTTAITTGTFPTPGKMPETIKTSQDVVAWYDAPRTDLPVAARTAHSHLRATAMSSAARAHLARVRGAVATLPRSVQSTSIKALSCSSSSNKLHLAAERFKLAMRSRTSAEQPCGTNK